MTRPSKPYHVPMPASLAGAAWLTQAPVQAVFKALAAGGEEARAVGGSVRNALLGVPVADVDIATTATPDAVLRLAAAAGLKAIPTGIEHGTVTIVAGGVPVEVTTLRRDIETFGRHARVTFTRDWAEDAQRRDFTINALYCAADGGLSDPLGTGLTDLAARRVRFIGEAGARIREDYLRILRFFRFTATYAGGPPDAEGLAAARAERDGVTRLSGERVSAELLRLLVTPRAAEAVGWMDEAGILTLVLGKPGNAARLARLIAIERATGRPADGVLRLAALAAAGPSDAPRLQARLRLSNEDTARIAAASGTALRLDAGSAEVAEALYRLGRWAAVDRWLIDWAGGAEAADDAARRAGLQRLTSAAVPVLPVRGADVLALGVPAGPGVGQIIAAFEAWWLGAGMPDDAALVRSKLAELARR